MNHRDHVELIEEAILPCGGKWADMGSGTGAFTLALRELAGPEVEIQAIDLDSGALQTLSRSMERRFPSTVLHMIIRDMEGIDLCDLDGIIAANSLHYVPYPRQIKVLKKWRKMLNRAGQLVIVEYDTDEGNHWVPYPFSFQALERYASEAGYSQIRRIGERPSRFLGRIYAASLTPGNIHE